MRDPDFDFLVAGLLSRQARLWLYNGPATTWPQRRQEIEAAGGDYVALAENNQPADRPIHTIALATVPIRVAAGEECGPINSGVAGHFFLGFTRLNVTGRIEKSEAWAQAITDGE